MHPHGYWLFAPKRADTLSTMWAIEVCRHWYSWAINKNGDRKTFVIIITDRYRKLTRATPTLKVTSTQVMHIFFQFRVDPYGTAGVIRSKMFKSLFFTSLCMFLGARELIATALHPYTNGHVKRCNKTSIFRLRLYISKTGQIGTFLCNCWCTRIITKSITLLAK